MQKKLKTTFPSKSKDFISTGEVEQKRSKKEPVKNAVHKTQSRKKK